MPVQRAADWQATRIVRGGQVAPQEAMAASRVTYFKADWTSEDPAITAALAEYGRSGVPLYLLYRQGAERAEVLPQLLIMEI